MVGSDVECKDGGVVDTDAESDADSDADSDTSSDGSATDLKAKVAKAFLKLTFAPAAINEEPATGGPSQTFRRHGVTPLWHDDYFWVCDRTSDFLQLRVRSQFQQPLLHSGMGTSHMSN